MVLYKIWQLCYQGEATSLPNAITHPEYDALVSEWEKYRYTYEGGHDFVDQYLERFSARETSGDFTSRKKISYPPNRGLPPTTSSEPMTEPSELRSPLPFTNPAINILFMGPIATPLPESGPVPPMRRDQLKVPVGPNLHTTTSLLPCIPPAASGGPSMLPLPFRSALPSTSPTMTPQAMPWE